MNLALNLLQLLFLLTATIFSVYIAFSGINNYFSANINTAQALSIIGLILLIFSARQSYIYLNYGLEIGKLISFPLLFLSLAFSLDIALGNVIEYWSALSSFLAGKVNFPGSYLVALSSIAAIIGSRS